MRRQARQEKLLRQKSSLMMCSRYCYERVWFKFLFFWINTGCTDTGNWVSGVKGFRSYLKISTQLVVVN